MIDVVTSVDAAQGPQDAAVLPADGKRPEGEAPKVDFSSIGALQKTAPKLYEALIIKGPMQVALIEMSRQEQKRKQRAKAAAQGA